MSFKVPEIIQTTSVEELAQLQSEAILSHGKSLARPISILEAGCGQSWLIDLEDLKYKLTGIDLDPAALELRQKQSHDLDEAICGDLCTAALPEASFDVIYSSFVLEHVPRADIALRNFVQWLRPGGILILILPDPATARGFLASLLPFWTHVWYFRHIYGIPLAGTPGHAPYPTFYHPAIRRERLCKFLAELGATTLGCYGDGFRREGATWVKRTILRSILKVTAMLSFGKLNANYTNVLYIAAKNG